MVRRSPSSRFTFRFGARAVMIDVGDFVHGGLSMQKRSGRLVFSPSDLIVFLESPFASWMDRFHVERPGELVPDEHDPQSKLVAKLGTEHEERELAALRAAGREVWTPPSREGAFEATLAAMRAGHDVIYQAALRRGDFEGHADFLVRVEQPSALGAFSYEVSDTKLARRPKPYFLLQLCAYAAMVEGVQGRRPDGVHVVTGDGAEHRFRTEDYVHYFRALEGAFLEAQRAFDPAACPLPDARAEHRRWTTHAERILEELDHPSRVANITSVQVKRLAEAGIETATGLARTTLRRVPRMEDRVFDRLRRQARLQLESSGREAPLFEVIALDEEAPRRGLALLPPRSAGDVFFDMEGYPFAAGGLEYLFGAVHVQNGQRVFFEQWAHDSASEKVAFEAFVDWLYARHRADRSMHVYHYGQYEVTALRRLMGQYATREAEVDALLRAEVFVDLLRVVRQGILVGEPRYSLKNVERLYRGARAGDVATAGESVVEYARWLEQPDGADFRTSKILAGIRAYNVEDCVSTLDLRDWLLERQREAAVAFVPAERSTRGSDADADVPDEDPLVARLRAGIPEDRSADPERWRIQTLLADVVGFHWRELKPAFWAKFDRRDASHEELAEDIGCLGNLRRTKARPSADGRTFEYAFDPDQDTKLAPGKCLLSHDLSAAELCSLDCERGVALVRFAVGSSAPPRIISLIPDEIVRPSPCDEALYAVVEAFAGAGELPGALDTLLRRTPPAILGHREGAPIVTPGMDVNAEVSRAIGHLDGTTLAIQGPPGSGKTTTAAAAIVDLIRGGFRVGVTSNGHRVIEKLMDEVLKAAGRAPIRATKIKSSRDEEIVMSGRASHATSMRNVDLESGEGPELVGGTAWAFCNEAAVGAFDYLFVDEASQVSLANVIAMSRSTKNLVLLGDQMQLAQPRKGSHPGESGQSALEYFLGDHRTIPDHLGIFLKTSWRLHPDVCRVVSEAVYDGRLEADAANASRVVRVPSRGGAFVQKEAGVVFVPVEHEGNAQASEEEVEVICAIVEEMLGRELVEKTPRGDAPPSSRRRRRARKVTAEDILVVAPYNMQVRALRRALPGGVRVGSVDKFQGQEAPIAIVSMCASSGECVARGVEFLFSANRLNVALSRAQSLAIVVASPQLARARATTVEQMRLVSFFCRAASEAR